MLVGQRANGGFDGELDVVGFNPVTQHVVHIECSLDADTWSKREERFAAKFDRGRKYVHEVVHGLKAGFVLDQVALMQLGGGDRTTLGGARLVWVKDFVADIIDELEHLSPDKRAVPSTLPLIRTMQLATQRRGRRKCVEQLIAPP